MFSSPACISQKKSEGYSQVPPFSVYQDYNMTKANVVLRKRRGRSKVRKNFERKCENLQNFSSVGPSGAHSKVQIVVILRRRISTRAKTLRTRLPPPANGGWGGGESRRRVWGTPLTMLVGAFKLVKHRPKFPPNGTS